MCFDNILHLISYDIKKKIFVEKTHFTNADFKIILASALKLRCQIGIGIETFQTILSPWREEGKVGDEWVR